MKVVVDMKVLGDDGKIVGQPFHTAVETDKGGVDAFIDEAQRFGARCHKMMLERDLNKKK